MRFWALRPQTKSKWSIFAKQRSKTILGKLFRKKSTSSGVANQSSADESNATGTETFFNSYEGGVIWKTKLNNKKIVTRETKKSELGCIVQNFDKHNQTFGISCYKRALKNAFINSRNKK